jgi:hypothetical protein
MLSHADVHEDKAEGYQGDEIQLQVCKLRACWASYRSLLTKPIRQVTETELVIENSLLVGEALPSVILNDFMITTFVYNRSGTVMVGKLSINTSATVYVVRSGLLDKSKFGLTPGGAGRAPCDNML